MAVFTKINKRDIYNIQNFFNIGKIISYHGIKEGIENTNYLISTKKQKFILTIFEKRVKKTDLPFFMKLMDKLSNLKIKCPSPLKNKKGNYLFNLKSKKACLVSFLKGKDKKKLKKKDLYVIGKNIGIMHKASRKIKLYRKNSFSPLKIKNLLDGINKNKIRITINTGFTTENNRNKK